MDKAIEKALEAGDLNMLSPEQRSTYYLETCQSLGLNPNTRPFKFLLLWDGNKKKKVLKLYASKDCTEQLRKLHKVTIAKLERDLVKELKIYTVTVYFVLPDGRQDSSIGAVSLEKWDKDRQEYVPLRGDDLANAIMKAETKAKRRGTLAICGLGMLDESELESMKDFSFVEDPDGVKEGMSEKEKFLSLGYDLELVAQVRAMAQQGIDATLWGQDRLDDINAMLNTGRLPSGGKIGTKIINSMIAKMETEIKQRQAVQMEHPGEETLAVWLDDIIDMEGDEAGFRKARNAEDWAECQRLYLEAIKEDA